MSLGAWLRDGERRLTIDLTPGLPPYSARSTLLPVYNQVPRLDFWFVPLTLREVMRARYGRIGDVYVF